MNKRITDHNTEKMTAAVRKVQQLCEGEAYAQSGWGRMLKLAGCEYAEKTAQQLSLAGALKPFGGNARKLYFDAAFEVTDELCIDAVIAGGGTLDSGELNHLQGQIRELEVKREGYYSQILNLEYTHAKKTVNEMYRAYRKLSSQISECNLRIEALEQDVRRANGSLRRFGGVPEYVEPKTQR